MRAILLAAALALAAGCASSNDDAPADNSSATDDTTTTTPPVAVSLSLIDRTPGIGVPPTTMGIDPSSIELAVGVPVNLTVSNNGNSGHDLVIDGLDVATESIAPGESFSIEFTPAEAGTYRMYCSVGGGTPLSHDMQGMNGEVVVS